MAYSNKDGLLKTLANVVRRSGITDKVTIIAKAKVPIIKFITAHGSCLKSIYYISPTHSPCPCVPGRISVDISINQINGIAAGKMINRFFGGASSLAGNCAGHQIVPTSTKYE